MNTELQYKKVIENWKGILKDSEYKPIKPGSIREAVTARLIENQVNFRKFGGSPIINYMGEAAPITSMGASSSTPGDGSVDIYDPVLISLLRRTIPNLIAYDVVGVQPMTAPTGIIFAFRPRYENQTGTEAWMTEANTAHAAHASNTDPSGWAAQAGANPALANSTNYTVQGPMTTEFGETLGSTDDLGFQEMSFSIERINVTAKTRGLRSGYTREIAQDLRTVHGLDVEQELSKILTEELLFEINREVLRSINISATVGAQAGTATAGTFDLDVDSDGRYHVEKFKGLLFRLTREANAIAKATRRGKGNFVLMGSDVAAALHMTGLLNYNPQLATDLEVDDTGNTFAGVINGMKVFIDPYFETSGGYEYATIGYKGSNEFDAGIFYCPYVPLERYVATDPKSFQPAIGYKTRYGLRANPFATTNADGEIAFAKKNIYYRRIAILHLT